MKNSLNIVLLHYHLNRGGVTRVIENQLRSLNHAAHAECPIRVLLCYGGRQAAWPDRFAEQVPNIALQMQVVPALEYDTEAAHHGLELAETLRVICEQSGFTAENTVIHAHNHSLGKNGTLPTALRLLADAGFGMLLQIHDFAEEFRPANYQLLKQAIGADAFSETVYPLGSRIHYAALNHRDQQRLHRAGVGAEHLHFLPNSVAMLNHAVTYKEARERLLQVTGILPEEKFILYPVRGIRRKNLGEFLLHAMLSPVDHHYGITLTPINPQEKISYDRWEQKATEWQLRCHFGVGEEGGLRFEENMAAADCMLTTSIAEGFGMVFLESWLMNHPLTGRDLPQVTHDFREAGLQLNGLYQRIDIPMAWIGRAVYLDKLSTVGEQLLKAYQRDDLPDQFWNDVLQQKVIDGQIDFADLDEPMQETVLERLRHSAVDREQLLKRNPQLGRLPAVDQTTILHNQQIVQQHYSLEANATRLIALYRGILSKPGTSVTAALDSELLLDQFLNLSQWRLLQG